MEFLKGIKIFNSSLNSLEFVGSLTFPEVILSEVYTFSNKIFIKEWVDCVDDHSAHRYFYYETTPEFLKAFLDLRISHLELIKRAKDGFYWFSDESKLNKEKVLTLLSLNNIPSNYLPAEDLELFEDDFVHSDLIKNRFQLDTIVDNKIYSQHTVFSEKFDSNIINLHLKEGLGIGYGTADATKLGRALIGFEDLYENVAMDLIFTNNRTSQKQSFKKINTPEGVTDLDVVGFMAASFSVMLKPKTDLFGVFGESTSDIILDNTIDIISKIRNKDDVDEVKATNSTFTISALKNFAEIIYKEELNVEIGFNSIQRNIFKHESISYDNAFLIIENLKHTSDVLIEKIEFLGKFTGVNCNTGHYWFSANTGEDINGYFDDLIKNSAYDINFHQLYRIVVSRKIENLEQNKLKITDLILAFYLDKGDEKH